MNSASSYALPAKQRRSQRSQELVVAAAETVLARDGWESFTMSAVASEAGVSVGGIYRRFPSKEHLLRAIKDNVLSRADTRQRELSAHKAKNLQHALEHYVRNRIDALQGYADILRKILDAQHNDPVMIDRGRQSVQLGLRTFRSVISPFRAEIRHPDPDVAIELAFYVLNATVLRRMHAYASDQVFDHIEWNVLKDELLAMLNAYLRSGPAKP